VCVRACVVSQCTCPKIVLESCSANHPPRQQSILYPHFPCMYCFFPEAKMRRLIGRPTLLPRYIGGVAPSMPAFGRMLYQLSRQGQVIMARAWAHARTRFSLPLFAVVWRTRWVGDCAATSCWYHSNSPLAFSLALPSVGPAPARTG
jgi:hypothetical protein